MQMKEFPIDVIHRILDYLGTIIYRHGKYMNRLSKDDSRYILVSMIKRPIRISENRYMLWLRKSRNDTFVVVLEYLHNNSEKKHYLTLNIIHKNSDFIYYPHYDITNSRIYLFHENEGYRKITNN